MGWVPLPVCRVCVKMKCVCVCSVRHGSVPVTFSTSLIWPLINIIKPLLHRGYFKSLTTCPSVSRCKGVQWTEVDVHVLFDYKAALCALKPAVRTSIPTKQTRPSPAHLDPPSNASCRNLGEESQAHWDWRCRLQCQWAESDIMKMDEDGFQIFLSACGLNITTGLPSLLHTQFDGS